MTYVDIGINLMNKQFGSEQKEVIEDALRENVKQMILTGTSVEASVKAVNYVEKMKEELPNTLFSTVGIHPHDARNFKASDIVLFENLLKNPLVVAVGECGIDFDRMHSPIIDQEKCFIAQLELAKKTGKPLFLHERGAHDRFIEIMNDYKELIPRAVVHCFTGNKEEVMDYVERGFYIGITGWVCDNGRGKDLQEAVKYIPLDRLMIETDGPYLTPKDLKPRPKKWRNEPKYLPHINRVLAQHIGMDEVELMHLTTKNAQTFFGI